MAITFQRHGARPIRYQGLESRTADSARDHVHRQWHWRAPRCVRLPGAGPHLRLRTWYPQQHPSHPVARRQRVDTSAESMMDQFAVHAFAKNRAEELGFDLTDLFVVPLFFDKLALHEVRKPLLIEGARVRKDHPAALPLAPNAAVAEAADHTGQSAEGNRAVPARRHSVPAGLRRRGAERQGLATRV